MKRNNIDIEPYWESRDRYDLAIVALGYETRARFFVESNRVSASTKIAIGFPDRHVCAYEKNREVLHSQGYDVKELDTERLREYLGIVLQGVVEEGRDLRFLVDISSFTRNRLAMIISEVIKSVPGNVAIDFVYSPASFSEPPQKLGPIQSLGPATPEFAGWSPDVDKPVLAVVGLGYEQDRAVGAIEYLEPGEVWAFVPVAKDQRYAKSLEDANCLLWQELPLSRRVYYGVDKPYELFVRLESLIFGALAEHRPVLVPFGPKIFALVCLLLGCQYSEVGVWRVSAGTFEVPVDRIPSGEINGLRVHVRGEAS